MRPRACACVRCLTSTSTGGTCSIWHGFGRARDGGGDQRRARVVAIDIDADAIDAAQESAALNTLPMAIEWVIGDFRAADASGVADARDLVLANLTGGMLIVVGRAHPTISCRPVGSWS